jgi:hypothetical protein
VSNYCQNCGSHSHCGSSLSRDEKDGDNKIINIKVCEHCRCEACQQKDTQNG